MTSTPSGLTNFTRTPGIREPHEPSQRSLNEDMHTTVEVSVRPERGMLDVMCFDGRVEG